MAPRNLSSNVVELKSSAYPDRRRGERRQSDERREADRARLSELARITQALALTNQRLRESQARKATSPAGKTWEAVLVRAEVRARELELEQAKNREPVKFALFAPNSRGLYVRKPASAK